MLLGLLIWFTLDSDVTVRMCKPTFSIVDSLRAEIVGKFHHSEHFYVFNKIIQIYRQFCTQMFYILSLVIFLVVVVV